MNFAGTQIARS